MISHISHPYSSQIEERMYGKLIYQLSLLSMQNDYYRIETSLIIDCSTFLSYKQSMDLPEGIVQEIVIQLEMLKMVEVDLYPSFYEDCLIDPHPITIRVTNTNVRNAITAIYDRWFDGKAYVQRKTRHLKEQDTYPAVLIQPHCAHELSMITRHPRTGKLMHGNDGAGLVHCSKPNLEDIEEKTIASLDMLINKPVKVYYYKEAIKGINSLTIRRVESYPMTADARINYLFSKVDLNDKAVEDFLCVIQPEDIATICAGKNALTATEQFIGLDAAPGPAIKGKAVFPWTELSSIPVCPIFLSTDSSPEDIELLKKCHGAIFSRGGMTSHGAVFCRGMRVKCITAAYDLIVNFHTKRAFVKIYKNTDPSTIPEYKEIKERDSICISGNKWALGGEIMPSEQFVPSSSWEVRQKIGSLLKPYTNEGILRNIPIEKQLHIATLIRALKGTGWKI